MKLPIIQYHVTVNGASVATFSNEPSAVKVSGEIAALIAAAGGTSAGAIGFGAVKSVVDADIDGIPGTLDTAALAEAFDREAVAQAEKDAAVAKAILDAALEVEEVKP